jgi:hypothetical protein
MQHRVSQVCRLAGQLGTAAALLTHTAKGCQGVHAARQVGGVVTVGATWMSRNSAPHNVATTVLHLATHHTLQPVNTTALVCFGVHVHQEQAATCLLY